jgi:hypothetical protein
MESNTIRKSSISSSKRILTVEGNILSIILVNHNPIIMGLLCNYICISRVYIALYTSVYFIKKNIFPQAYFFQLLRDPCLIDFISHGHPSSLKASFESE